jgi:hypothetical protein
LNAHKMRQQTVSLDHVIESTSIAWRSLRKKRETQCSDKYILRLKNYLSSIVYWYWALFVQLRTTRMNYIYIYIYIYMYMYMYMFKIKLKKYLFSC